MKKLLIALLSSVGLFAATPLGVLYESTSTNNETSPFTLTIPNARITTNAVLDIAGIVANRAIRVDSGKHITTSSLTSTQQDYLGTIVGGLNTLILGGAEIVSGDHTPTNGTAYIQRILYINSTGTNLNDTFWGNYGTNWYAIASTNGGSIVESQLNFSDNTTANATTNMHGLLLKLAGNTNLFLRSDGTWNSAYVLTPYTGAIGPKPILIVDPTVIPGSTNTVNYYDNGFNYSSGTLNVTNIALGPIFGGAGATLIGGSDSTVGGGLSLFQRANITGLSASKLLRLNSTNGIDVVSIGSGLSFDGVTLSSSGAGTNALGISGSPVSGNVTYWVNGTTVSGNNNMVFDGSKLTVTHYGVPSNDTTGQLTGGNYTPTVIPVNYLGTPTCNLIGVTQPQIYYIRVGKIVTVSGKVEVNGSGAFPRVIFLVTTPSASAAGGDIYGSFTPASPSGARLNPLLNASITQNGGSAYFIYEANGGALAGLLDFFFTFTYREN